MRPYLGGTLVQFRAIVSIVPIRNPRVWFAIVVVVLAAAVSCRSERTSVMRVGDAIPRNVKEPTLLDAVRPLLVDGIEPRIDIIPWSASASDLGIGESEQADTFIADPSIVAVVGHAGSKGTLLTKPMYREAGMPLIVPTATAVAIGDPASGVFTLAPPDNVIGAFLVDEAVDHLHARRVGVLHVADPYGDGVRDGVAERLRARGDSLVGSAALSGRECETDGLPMDAIVRAFLQRVRPDAVIIAMPQGPTWCAIRRFVAEQPDITVITSDSYAYTDGAPLTSVERAHLHSLVFWTPGNDSITQRFVARSRVVFKRDPDAGQALSYDAFRLIKTAIREGNVTRASISTWLQQLGTPGHPAFQGITGPIDFKTSRKSILHLQALSDSVRMPPAKQ